MTIVALIGADLVYLTEVLVGRGLAENGGGGLGGEFGYGASFENDTFLLRPYCWCDLDTCLWCGGATEDAPIGLAETIAARFGRFWADKAMQAPQFFHKPTRTGIGWYKWIGRGMLFDRALSLAAWKAIYADCLHSLGATTEQKPPLIRVNSASQTQKQRSG